MSVYKETTEQAAMERTGRSDRNRGAMVWTIIALLGTAALAYVVARKVVSGQDPWDADSLLEAADRAANQLDSILLAEGHAVS